MHAIAHFGMLIAIAFSGTCVVLLLIMLGIIATDKTKPTEGYLWQVPGVVVFLAIFWAAAAYGLHLV